MNRPITCNEVQYIRKQLPPPPKKKGQDQMVSQENSIENREELTPSLIKVFQKMS